MTGTSLADLLACRTMFSLEPEQHRPRASRKVQAMRQDILETDPGLLPSASWLFFARRPTEIVKY
jgi:hypothetical protein